jgi:hypothetical protein
VSFYVKFQAAELSANVLFHPRSPVHYHAAIHSSHNVQAASVSILIPTDVNTYGSGSNFYTDIKLRTFLDEFFCAFVGLTIPSFCNSLRMAPWW